MSHTAPPPLAAARRPRAFADGFALLRVALATAAGLGLAGVVACFEPPAGDVLFACDPVAAPECPPDYRCELDGCCHRIGSDVSLSLGACRFGSDGGDTDTDTSGETDGSATDGSTTDGSTTAGSTATGTTDTSETDGSTATGTTDGSTATGTTDGSTATGTTDGSTATGTTDGSTAGTGP
jgi:hypothetical protein